VMEASGKETRGAGTASATVRASLAPDASGNGTQVTMHTTMNVTGRPAQFGRGVMVEVGGKLVDQFAANLAQLIAEDTGAGGGPAAPADAASGDGGDGASATTNGTTTNGTTTNSPVGNGAGSGGTATATASTATGTAVPVTSTTAPPQDDSLNLVKLVGPALLKRVVPVVVGAAGLALLSRFLWRLRHRRSEKA
jgi:uncharacterized protein